MYFLASFDYQNVETRSPNFLIESCSLTKMKQEDVTSKGRNLFLFPLLHFWQMKFKLFHQPVQKTGDDQSIVK